MQRKRHINFKLHSIPISLNMKKSISKDIKDNVAYDINENNVKSSVLYSIPCGCILALLLVAFLNLVFYNDSYAIICNGTSCTGTISDQTIISPVSGTTTTPATASLSLSNPNMTSSAITPGSTATVSTNVTVNVDNADSYSLSLKVDSTTLQNGSTTIVPGNPNDDTKTNVWGYKWDNASTYTTPSTTAQTLTVPALSNNAVNFTKNLTFGAKFSTSAEAGHYKGNGTLSLVATPRAAVVTLANLTQMQQLAEGYAPEACANTPYLDGQNYSAEYTLTDVRDGNVYTVRKLGDGKCWMTQNLGLWNKNTGVDEYYLGGRVLKSSTSDISATTWTLPASSTSGFSDDTASNIYYNYSNSTGYYTWCAATAGTCSSATSGGQQASSSICPKGWKLPSGNSGGEFEAFANAEGIANSSAGSTKIRGAPYHFAYTGYVSSGTFYDPSSDPNGYWWSRTAYSGTQAYSLYIGSGNVYPGTRSVSRQLGFAVRCVAQ